MECKKKSVSGILLQNGFTLGLILGSSYILLILYLVETQSLQV